MAYIYKIINDINNKIYIGKTYYSIEKRFAEHCADRTKRRNEKRPLYSAMNKYGVEHFHISLIEEVNNPEEREKYWIEYSNSYHNGYNATYGGDGKPYADVNLILSLWKEGKTNKEIQQITGYDRKTITNHLENNGISEKERKDRGKISVKKPLAMLDIQTEQIIQVFSSATEAEKFLQKVRAHTHIVEVCKGKRKTAYGYKWRYI